MKTLLNPLKMAFFFFVFLFSISLTFGLFIINSYMTVTTMIARSFNCSLIFSILGAALSFVCKYILFADEAKKLNDDVVEEEYYNYYDNANETDFFDYSEETFYNNDDYSTSEYANDYYSDSQSNYVDDYDNRDYSFINENVGTANNYSNYMQSSNSYSEPLFKNQAAKDRVKIDLGDIYN